MNLEILQAKKQKILEIAARHGVYNIRIFGSVARGEATEESDIDFLMIERDLSALKQSIKMILLIILLMISLEIGEPS